MGKVTLEWYLRATREIARVFTSAPLTAVDSKFGRHVTRNFHSNADFANLRGCPSHLFTPYCKLIVNIILLLHY